MDRNAYLFTWNYKNWGIEKLTPIIDQVRKKGYATDRWSISAYTKVKIGDRAFVTRVYSETKGIFASGTIISEPKTFFKYNGNKAQGVNIEFDIFLNPETDRILEIDYIKSNTPIHQDWSPRKSGIKINDVNKVELLWSIFCTEHNAYSENIGNETEIIEGTSYQLTQTVYERNRYARVLCLKHHGYSCAVCDFNFEKAYGDIGKAFIHVHHLNQPSNIGEKHETNPIIDLRPVCPNCHAMLHKANPPFTIEELKSKMKA